MHTRADRTRTALQAPLSHYKCRVVYIREGRECRSPWLYSRERGHLALKMMQDKYGARSAVLYID